LFALGGLVNGLAVTEWPFPVTKRIGMTHVAYGGIVWALNDFPCTQGSHASSLVLSFFASK